MFFQQGLTEKEYSKMAAPRICVIGAGPSGMSSLVQLKLRQDEGLGPFDITCFESQPTWGGNWNFFWRTGIN
jgi:trimethylamine monooxygenase